MNTRRVLGWLLIVLAGLLAYSQTLSVIELMDIHIEGSDFPRRYAIEWSIYIYGLALVVVFVGILVLRSSARIVAWAAVLVSLFALWFLVGDQLWFHYHELPRDYVRFAIVEPPPYFPGTYWMFTPRFIWHLILPVITVLSVIYAFSSTRKDIA